MDEWLRKLEGWIRKQPVGATGGGSHPGLDMLRKALDEQAAKMDAAWEERLATARAEGFAAAREKAAELARLRILDEAAYLGLPDETADVLASKVVARIRAIKDEQAQPTGGETST